MKSFLLLLNLVQFMVILSLTNPSEYQHLEYITERAQQELRSDAPLLDKIMGAARTAGKIDARYQNHHIASVTRKDDQLITIGVLGKVWWADDLLNLFKKSDG